MSGRMSPRSGSDFRTPENFFSSTSTQSGNPICVADLQRLRDAGLLLRLLVAGAMTSPALHW